MENYGEDGDTIKLKDPKNEEIKLSEIYNGETNIGGGSNISDKKIAELEKRLAQKEEELSNAKLLISSAITNKGVATNSNDTFDTMATNIQNIRTEKLDFENISNYYYEFKRQVSDPMPGELNCVASTEKMLVVISGGGGHDFDIQEIISFVAQDGDLNLLQSIKYRNGDRGDGYSAMALYSFNGTANSSVKLKAAINSVGYSFCISFIPIKNI